MKKTVDVSFSDQAEMILDETGYSRDEVVDFLVENGGFTVGGNEVISFLDSNR